MAQAGVSTFPVAADSDPIVYFTVTNTSASPVYLRFLKQTRCLDAAGGAYTSTTIYLDDLSTEHRKSIGDCLRELVSARCTVSMCTSLVSNIQENPA